MATQLTTGDEFSVERVVDPYRAIYYSAASGDFNPIHIDVEAGRAAGLGGTILHGMCTLAFMVEAVVSHVGDPTRIAKARTRFSRPVAIGDVLTFKGRVTAANETRATVEIAATNQKGEDVLKGGSCEVRQGGLR